MTPARAYSIASQWGSYIRAGDPGACFYSFSTGNGRPYSEEHRAECLAWARLQHSRLTTARAWGTVPEAEADADLDDLQSLIAWFESCDLRHNELIGELT